jgi:hypothetical protein
LQAILSAIGSILFGSIGAITMVQGSQRQMDRIVDSLYPEAAIKNPGVMAFQKDIERIIPLLLITCPY